MTNSDNRYSSAISRLEELWSEPDGILYRLRQGEYRPGLADTVQTLLSSLEVNEDSQLPRRLVSLTWYIPTFIEWQLGRVKEAGGDVSALKREIDTVRNAVTRLLGAP